MKIFENFSFAYYNSQGNIYKMKPKILILFGKNVQRERKLAGLSQEQLAEAAGLHRTYIGMIERAEKNITLRNIEKIANALNISIIDLLKL